MSGHVTRLALLALAGLAWILPVHRSAHADALHLLRREGVTLYLRHADADWTDPAPETGTLDAARLDARACAERRKLTEQGRLQMQALRSALQGLDIHTIEVHAAGLCRMFETARMLSNQVRIVEGMTPLPGRVPALRMQGEALAEIVRAPARGRLLRIVIGDYELPQALFGMTLGEGDGLVLAHGGNGLDLLGRITSSEWMALQPVASGERPATGHRKF